MDMWEEERRAKSKVECREDIEYLARMGYVEIIRGQTSDQDIIRITETGKDYIVNKLCPF